MRRPLPLLLAMLSLAAVLGGCSTPDQAPVADDGAATSASASPAPDESPRATPSPSPSPVDGLGWIVRAENAYISASGRVCSDEDVLTAGALDGGSIYLEASGGMPDDWTPGTVYEIDSNGIFLNLLGGTYYAKRFDGDLSTGIGDVWETPNGPLEVRRDEFGVVTGGTGTGETRFISRYGDVSRSPDVMTFTVERAPDAPWCDLSP